MPLKHLHHKKHFLRVAEKQCMLTPFTLIIISFFITSGLNAEFSCIPIQVNEEEDTADLDTTYYFQDLGNQKMRVVIEEFGHSSPETICTHKRIRMDQLVIKCQETNLQFSIEDNGYSTVTNLTLGNFYYQILSCDD